MTTLEKKLDIRVEFTKVDRKLGLVFGWALICKKNGEPYFDLQGHHIPEDVMMETMLDFMEKSRVAKEQHRGGKRGTVPFCFPWTDEIAKQFGVPTPLPQSGCLVAMKADDAMLAKCESGELTGFSIGGVLFDADPAEES